MQRWKYNLQLISARQTRQQHGKLPTNPRCQIHTSRLVDTLSNRNSIPKPYRVPGRPVPNARPRHHHLTNLQQIRAPDLPPDVPRARRQSAVRHHRRGRLRARRRARTAAERGVVGEDVVS